MVERNPSNRQRCRSDRGISLTKNNVTAVVPVLNEEGAIGMVLDELFSNGYRNILVVDGYSKDNTVQIAESKGVHVVRQHGMGKTGAIKTAIDLVPTPYMVVMDDDYIYAAIQLNLKLVDARRLNNTYGIHRTMSRFDE